MQKLVRRLLLTMLFLGLGGFLGHTLGLRKAKEAAADCKVKSGSQEEVILMICDYETDKLHYFGVLIGLIVGAGMGIAIAEITMPKDPSLS